jgi:cellulose biosynthesis protein BcsQ
MAVVAVYNVKGGVGKTSLAVNLAWASARLGARRTLLWDLDPQGGAGLLLGEARSGRARSRDLFDRKIEPGQLVRPSPIPGLDLLVADPGLYEIGRFFDTLGKRRRLARIAEDLGRHYDRIVIDCPPVLNELTDQIIRACDVMVVPIVPSPLALHALEDVSAFLKQRHKSHPAILPVLSMFDARRRLHNETRDLHPNWPVMPMASVVEQMGLRHLPVGEFAGASPSTQAIARLWSGIERRLAESAVTEVS